MPEDCDSYDQYISRIINRLKKDLIREYPDADYEEEDALWDILDCIFDMYDGQKFILSWMSGIVYFIKHLSQEKINKIHFIFK